MHFKNLLSFKKDPIELLITLNSLGASLVLGELFYKFGSFTLEVICFLGTWLVLHNLIHLVIRKPTQL